MEKNKILIIYYTKSGNTRIVANDLHKNLKEFAHVDCEEIINVYPDGSGIFNYIKIGAEALFGKKYEIHPITHDIKQYDIVIIGTPIWASSMTPSIRSFIEIYRKSINRVAFFSTTGGNDDNGALISMGKLIQKNPIATISLSSKLISKANQSIIDKYNDKMQKFKNTLFKYMDIN